MDPLDLLLSQLGPKPADTSFPGRLNAGLQSGLNAGNLPSAIGGLLSGLMTGQRSDSDYLDMQTKLAQMAQARKQHGASQGLAERKFQADEEDRRIGYRSLVNSTDEETGDQVPSGVFDKRTMQIYPMGRAPAGVPPGAGAPGAVPGATPGPVSSDETIPANAQPVQSQQPMFLDPNGNPLKGRYMREAKEQYSKDTGKATAKSQERAAANAPLANIIKDMDNQVEDPLFAKATETLAAVRSGLGQEPHNPYNMAYEAKVDTPVKGLLGRINQNAKALEMELARQAYQGQGQVTEAERERITQLVGKVHMARSVDEARQMLKQIRFIITNSSAGKFAGPGGQSMATPTPSPARPTPAAPSGLPQGWSYTVR